MWRPWQEDARENLEPDPNPEPEPNLSAKLEPNPEFVPKLEPNPEFVPEPQASTSSESKIIGALSKQSQILVRNAYEYAVKNKLGKGAVTETAKILKLSRPTVRNIVQRGPRTPQKRGNKRAKFDKTDDFVCDFLRREVYSFYSENRSPSIDELLLNVRSEFPYGRTTLWQFLHKLGFRFCRLDKRKRIMESARIVAWRYEYLHRLNQLRAEGCQIVYLDETWYDTHDVTEKGWVDGSCACTLNAPVSRGKCIMILHAGGIEGFYLSAKNIGDAKADYHDDMTAAVFENWFCNNLLKNLPQDKKCVIVLDNASYQIPYLKNHTSRLH